MTQQPKHTPAPMRKVYIDETQKGILRFEDDPTGGILVGREASNFARAINSHDELLKVLEGLSKIITDMSLNCKIPAENLNSVKYWQKQSKALLAKARG